MRRLPTRIALMLVAVAVSSTMVGCSCGRPPADAGGETVTDGGGSSGESGGAPALEVLHPKEGATVKAGEVTVRLKVSNLRLVPGGGARVAGEGHVHYMLDGDLTMKPADSFTFSDVARGQHTLVVELVGNDHQPLDSPVSQRLTFKAE